MRFIPKTDTWNATTQIGQKIGKGIETLAHIALIGGGGTRLGVNSLKARALFGRVGNLAAKMSFRRGKVYER